MDFVALVGCRSRLGAEWDEEEHCCTSEEGNRIENELLLALKRIWVSILAS